MRWLRYLGGWTLNVFENLSGRFAADELAYTSMAEIVRAKFHDRINNLRDRNGRH